MIWRARSGPGALTLTHVAYRKLSPKVNVLCSQPEQQLSFCEGNQLHPELIHQVHVL